MLQAILFGILQGLTEFFPVSSSGHLVVFKHIVPGMQQWESGIEFEVAVHLGTTVAVLLLFWREVVEIFRECVSIFRKAVMERKPLEALQGPDGLPLAAAIVLATIPTVLIAVPFKDTFERMFSSVGLVGVAFAVTGALLWVTRWFDQAGERRPLGAWRASIVGVVQGIAIIPGISRSGSTISAGLILRLDREKAAKFSFLPPHAFSAGDCSARP